MTATRYRIHPDLSFRIIDGEAVILQVATTTYYSLNPTGTVLWEALRDGATRDEMVGKILETYDVDRPTAEKDVDALLEDMTRENLLATEEV